MTANVDSDYADPLCRNLMSDFSEGPERDSLSQVNPGESNDDKYSRERMKVYLRIRPFTTEEKQKKEDQGCLELVDANSVLLTAPKDSFNFKSSTRGIAEQSHKFSFSTVYSETVSQKDFFDDSMLSYIKDFIHGQNCLIFTYGVTNAGKTYTIQGTAKDGGILPRCLDVLFNSIRAKLYTNIDIKPKMYNDVVKLTKEQQQYEQTLRSVVFNAGEKENVDLSTLFKLDASCTKSNSTISDSSVLRSLENSCIENDNSLAEDIKNRISDETVVDIEAQGPIRFSIWVSFAEIYNEYVYDLLDPTPNGKGKRRPALKLGDDKNGNPYIKGLKEVKVDTADEAVKVLRVGLRNQNVAATKLNQHSSRSHSIFTIKAVRVVDIDEPNVARVSRIQFVDLAGSERCCKTRNQGDRLREAANINTSIMTLGKCIENLRYNQVHVNHPTIIPFRESKLTRLFQGFFLGKGKACMIVNINQCASYFDETYHVLKFSAIAKQVTTKAPRPTEIWKVPEVPKPTLTPAPSVRGTSTTPYLLRGTPSLLNTPALRNANEGLAMVQDEAIRKVIEDLRTRLIEEKRKAFILERKIREEVCQEMSEQMVEIENNYRERLEAEQQCMEDLCDRRIELLTKSLKKARKKRKLDDDDQDEYVSSVLFQSEKMKVKERDDTIRVLKQKVAEMQRKVDFMAVTSKPEAVERLQSQLAEAQETLTLQEKHIEELETTVCDEREEKELALEKLNDVVANEEQAMMAESNILEELRQLLDSTTQELNTARMKLDERDHTIKRLKLEVEAQKGEIEDVNSLREEGAHLKRQLDVLRQRSDFKKNEMTEMVASKDNDLRQLKNNKTTLEDKVAHLQEKNEELLFEKDELDIKLARYEEIAANHKSALTDSESLIEQLNRRVAQQSKELEALRDSKHCSSATSTIIGFEINGADIASSAEDLKATIEKLVAKEEELCNLQKDYEMVTNECNSLKRKQEEEEPLRKSLMEQVETLNKDLTRLASENESLREEEKSLEEINDMKVILTDVEEKIKDYREKSELVEYLSCEVKELKDDLQKERDQKSACSEELGQSKEKLALADAKVASLERRCATLVSLQSEVEHLKEEAGFSSLKLADKENELLISNQEIERLQTELAMVRTCATELEDKEKSLASYRETTDSLRSEMETLKREHDQECGKLNERLASVLMAEEQAKKEIQCLKLEVTKLETARRSHAELQRDPKMSNKAPKDKFATPGRSPCSPASRTHFGQIRKLEKSLEEATQKLEEKDRCIEDKKKKLEKLREQLRCHDLVQTELDNAAKENEELKKEIDQLKIKRDEQPLALSETAGIIEELQKEGNLHLSHVRSSAATIASLQAEVQSLQTKFKEQQSLLRSKQEENDKLQEAASNRDEEVEELQEKLEEQQEKGEELATELSRVKSANEKLQAEKDKMGIDLTSTKELLFKTREGYRKMKEDIIHLERDLETKATDLTIKEYHLRRLEDQEKKFLAEIQSLTERLHEGSILVSEFSEKQCDCQAMPKEQRDNIKSLQNTVRELQEECVRKAEKLELRERTICNQKEKYMQLAQKLQVKDALLVEEHKNQDIVFRQQKQIHEYERLVDQHADLMKEKMDELVALRSQVCEFEKTINTMEEKMTTLKREVQEKKQVNGRLQDELQNARRSLKALEAEQKWVEDMEVPARSRDQEDKENCQRTPATAAKQTELKESSTKRRSSEIPLSELKDMLSSEKKRKSSIKSSEKKSIRSGKSTRSKPNLDSHENENSGVRKSKKVLFDLDDQPDHEPDVILNTPEEGKENEGKALTGRKKRRKLCKKSVTDFNLSPVDMRGSRSNENQTAIIIQRQLRSRNK